MVTAAESVNPSFVSPATLERAEKMAVQKWGMERLTALTGLQFIRNHSKRQSRQLDAEAAAVQSKLLGGNQAASKADDQMGDHIILGDNTNPAPIIISHPQPQQQSSGLGQLLGAALAGASLLGIPGAGVAAYLYGKSQAEPVRPDTTIIERSEDLGLGLLKLEDLRK